MRLRSPTLAWTLVLLGSLLWARPSSALQAVAKNASESLAPTPELERLGEVRFDLSTDPDALLRLGRRFMDRLGRVWFSDSSDGTIHVFDLEGAPLFTCTPDPKDGLAYHPYHSFGLTPEGALVAWTSTERVEFDTRGQRVACATAPRPIRRFLGAPWNPIHWEIGDREVALVPSDGGERRTEWRIRDELHEIVCSAVDSAGTLAFCDERRVPSLVPEVVERSLHVFGADGALRFDLALPHDGSAFDLAIDGRGAVLLVHVGSSTCLGPPDPPFELWTVDANGVLVERVRLPRDVPSAGQVFLSPEGDEIWIFPFEEPVLYRFARRAR